MTKVVEQLCTIRAVDDNGSNFTLSLAPKKQKCKGCDGKCAKMLKPEELIKVQTDDKSYKVDDEVMLYMEKTYLRNLVISILGLPLLALLAVVILGTIFNFAEWQIILAIFASLILIFALQVKYLKFTKQIMIRKPD